jgi:hypothetical protein
MGLLAARLRGKGRLVMPRVSMQTKLLERTRVAGGSNCRAGNRGSHLYDSRRAEFLSHGTRGAARSAQAASIQTLRVNADLRGRRYAIASAGRLT